MQNTPEKSVGLIRQVARAWGCESGGVALLVAFALPVLLAGAGAATDYGLMAALKVKLQTAADAAAISATRELQVASNADQGRYTAVARSVVNSHFGLPAADATITVSASPNSKGTGIDVQLGRQYIPTAVGRFITSGSVVSATAGAERVGGGKMCVLVLSLKDPTENEVLKLENQAQVTGQDCGIFSNSLHKDGVNAKDTSVLKGSLLCSAGGFKLDNPAGYVGERRTDCPVIDNPMKDRPAPTPGPCTHTDSAGKGVKLVIESSRDLLPGTYCEGIEIKGKGTVVNLRPSGSNDVLIIKDGQLKVSEDAKLVGRGVGISFHGDSANFEFGGTSTIDLVAPTSGPLAGVLFFGSLSAPDWREYKITSDNARVLVGTIYLPKGYFTIDAKNPVADQSAYTAVIVNKLKLKDSPKLVLNTNYHQTQVPVPEGVAKMGGGVVLSK